MAGYCYRKVYKNMLDDKGQVIRTKHVDSIWVSIEPRTPEEENEIAKAWKGDVLASADVDMYDFEAKDRHPRFNRQIITNLRFNNKDLFKDLTDDELYNAYDHWSVSGDYPDEAAIIKWVRRKEA